MSAADDPAAADDAADVDVALPTPVRQQLVALAAEVVGRAPADELPASLRPLARFTPAKRAKLGAVVLATALDGDDAFRASVAEALVDGTPELVAAVASGTSTAASDPVDVAVVAYLTRPDGWELVLADALRRWASERDGVDGARAELEQLRSEVARLRADARGEAARVRDAVASALADTAETLQEARRQLRRRTGELRAAEREAAAARDDADAARAALEDVRATHATDLQRERDRTADAERNAEAARRDVRTGRDVADARLWLLTETLVSAAQGVRRELSLAPPALRPGDTVGGAVDAAGGGLPDGGALDRVLGLPAVHLVIDGYNVTKTGYPELPLADQRTRLVASVASLVARKGVEATVVFDGATRPPAQPATPRGVRVLFSAPGEIADDVVRRVVAAEPPGRPVVVVTSDQAIVRDVRRDGAYTADSSVLLARFG